MVNIVFGNINYPKKYNKQNTVKKIILLILIILTMANCATTGNNKNMSSISGQSELDSVIRSASNYLNTSPLIEKGSTIVIFAADTKHQRLTEYIMTGISRNAVNDLNFSVANRRNQELIRAESRFQLSGYVSEETIQSITGQIGASVLFSVGISQIGSLYLFHLQALSIGTGLLQGEERYSIQESSFIRDLEGITPVSGKKGPKENSNNMFDYIGILGKGGVSISNMVKTVGHDEHKEHERLGYAYGGTYGFALPIRLGKVQSGGTFSIEPGVLFTQRGFDDTNSPDKVLITYTDYYLTIGNFDPIPGFSNWLADFILGAYIGVVYSVSSNEIFKDDIFMILGSSSKIRFSQSPFYIRLGWDVKLGGQKVFYDYRSENINLYLGAGYGI